jgi:hypothetical protein
MENEKDLIIDYDLMDFSDIEEIEEVVTPVLGTAYCC